MLPSDQSRTIEQAKVTYSSLAKALEKQTKTIEYTDKKQIKTTEDRPKTKIKKHKSKNKNKVGIYLQKCFSCRSQRWIKQK